MMKIYLVALMSFGSMALFSQEDSLSQEFTVTSTKVGEYLPQVSSYNGGETFNELGQILKEADQMIALGQKVYKIVNDGRAVLREEYAAPINVLPKREDNSIVDPMMMTGWRKPKAVRYNVELKNVYGIVVAHMEFDVSFNYGGKYNGRGAYLSSITAWPTSLELCWGFTMETKFSLIGIVNHGTEDNPIVGATLLFTTRVSSVLKTIQIAQKIHLSGTGEIVEL